MTDLMPTTRTVLDWLQTRDVPYPPTVREVASGTGLSVGTIHAHLEILKDEGIISWEPYRSRTIVILERNPAE